MGNLKNEAGLKKTRQPLPGERDRGVELCSLGVSQRFVVLI